MSLKKAFGTNKTKEENGTWINVCVNDDGSICRMRLARMTSRNKHFMAKIAKINKANRGTTIRKNATPTVAEDDVKKAIDVFVETILLGWEHVEEYRKEKLPAFPSPGKIAEMEFNFENATFLLTDLPDLFELLTGEATKLENFQDEIDTEAVKN